MCEESLQVSQNLDYYLLLLVTGYVGATVTADVGVGVGDLLTVLGEFEEVENSTTTTW